jgi:histidinol-phosphatase
MVSYSFADDLALALTAAASADLVSLPRFQAQDLVVTTKPDRTPVTDADTAVEKLIRSILTASRPDDAILGEEFGSTGDRQGPQPGRQWIIDPIDGTAGFSRGLPIWATLIALAIDGEPVVGVVSAPALNKRWWGAQGLGATALDTHSGVKRTLGVSQVGRVSDATVSYNSLPGWIEDGREKQVQALATTAWRARALGDFWSYMLVAEGSLDMAGEADLQPYDIAALVPIVVEAGGQFSSLDGAPGIWNTTALATNGLIHHEVVALTQKAPKK